MRVLPTFIVAGAKKCGTTALWQYLVEHPDIRASRIKEPGYFSTAEKSLRAGNNFGDGPARSGSYERGVSWYYSLYGENINERAIGEASTVYFVDQSSADLIWRHNPDVKLVFLLRDPVARLYSHYWQEYKLGFNFPAFATMVEQNHPRFRYYLKTSRYSVHLKRYFNRFPKKNIEVLLFRDLKKSPDKLMNRVYKSLGVDSSFVPSTIGERFNQQTSPRIGAIARLTEILRDTFKNSIPLKLQSSLGSMRAWIEKYNQVKFDYPPLPTHLRHSLLPHFHEDIEFVEEVTQSDLSEWKS